MLDKIFEVILVNSVSVLKFDLYAELKNEKDSTLLNCGRKNFNVAFSINFEMKDKFVIGL